MKKTTSATDANISQLRKNKGITVKELQHFFVFVEIFVFLS
jgi:hypothetical protein